MRPRTSTRRASLRFALALAATVGAVPAASAVAASVRSIEPPSGAALIEGPVTLRWGLDVSGCDPGKTALTLVEVEVDGQPGPQFLPEPPGSGMNAGMFAAAAAGGFRFTLNAVNVRTDGAPSVYRWRAFVDCTGPGIPPDPTAVPVQVVGPWSEFRVTRVGAAPGTTPTPAPTPAGPRPGERRHRFRVELKAWIPQRAVVDPLRPGPITVPGFGVGAGPLECTPPGGFPELSEVSSTFRGDGHRLYPGSSRLLGIQSFDVFMDIRTQRVTRVVPTGMNRSVGRTYRDLVVRDLRTPAVSRCSQSALAGGDPVTGAFTGARRWFTKLRGSNPLVVPSPNIDARLDGGVRPNGALVIRYSADRMPSIGIRVVRDGRTVVTNIVNDVSCRALRGVSGAVEIGNRLTTSNGGRFSVPLRGGLVARAPCP